MKEFEYSVEIVGTHELQTTLDYKGRNKWELATTSIKESKKEGFEKILLIFKREK